MCLSAYNKTIKTFKIPEEACLPSMWTSTRIDSIGAVPHQVHKRLLLPLITINRLLKTCNELSFAIWNRFLFIAWEAIVWNKSLSCMFQIAPHQNCFYASSENSLEKQTP